MLKKLKEQALMATYFEYDIDVNPSIVSSLIDVVETFKNFDQSLKGKSGAILGGKSLDLLQKVRKAVEALDD